MKKISIITPFYNENQNLKDCCNLVKSFLKENLKNYDYEHILVDNYSNDGSTEIAEDLCLKDKKIKIIQNSQNYGIMPSLFNALKYCKSDLTLVFFPADMQDQIDFLIPATKKIEDGFDIVYAIRKYREEKFLYKILKKAYYFLAKLLTNNVLKTNVNVFQLITENVRKEITSIESNNPFIPYLIQSTSFKKIGIETKWVSRKKNQAKNNFFSLMDESINALCNYSGLASKISFFLSIGTFFFSIIFLIINLTGYFLNFKKIDILPGIPSIIIFNSLMFAILFLILGFISENVNHLLQNKIGKKVNVKNFINFDD